MTTGPRQASGRLPGPRRWRVTHQKLQMRCAAAYLMSAVQLPINFSIGGQEGYLTVGVYEDGSPGEIFVRMAKEGSTVSGLMDGLATVVSLALQHGVPLRVLCAKLSHMRFEPSGWTGNPKIGFAKSILDYIARWLELRFLNNEQGELFGSISKSADALLSNPSHKPEVASLDEFVELGDSPACNICGGLMVRSGSCYRCMMS